MIVRPLTVDDAPAYVALRADSLKGDPFAFAASPEDDVAASIDFIRARFAEPNRRIFGAFDPELIGAVGIHRNATIKGAHKAHVWGMYVRPDKRRAGVGALLMKEVVSFAAGLSGVRQVHLCVSERSEEAAALYRRIGFSTWGIEPKAMQIECVAVAEQHMVLDFDGAA